MTTSTAAGSLPASSSPPEAASLSVHIDRLLRFVTMMAVLLAGAAFLQSSFFSVSSMDVRGADQVAVDEIIVRSGVRPGDPKFTIRAADVAARIRRHPRIAGARVVIDPSGRVRIAVTERRAVAALSYHHAFLLVDATGVLVEQQASPDGLPVLRVDGLAVPWMVIGDEIPAPQIGQALRVLRMLPQSVKRGVLEISMDSAGEFSVTADGLVVLLGPMRGLRERAAMLPQVLTAMNKQQIAAEYIDLRFLDNIVLRPVTLSTRGGDAR